MRGAESVAELESVAAGAEDVYLAVVEVSVKTLAGDAGRATVMLPHWEADGQVGAASRMVGEDGLDVFFNGEKCDGMQVLERSVALDIALMAGEGVVEELVGIRLLELILGNEHRWGICQHDGVVENSRQQFLALEHVAQVGGDGGTVFHLHLDGRGGTGAWFGGYEHKSASSDADFKHAFC